MFYDDGSSTSVERRPKEFLSSNFGRNRLLRLTRLSLRYTADHILVAVGGKPTFPDMGGDN